jgi:pimeloyl-ACP methyl ester carboxylesterase
MASTKRLIRSSFRLLLPTVVLVLVAVLAAALWLVHNTASPAKSPYLVTPEKYGRLSPRGSQVTDEIWSNRDGTSARGWLLRGAQNAPAVVLLHRYGADRSWLLDLGVKINEATNFTILMPDLRGHGENPLVNNTSFGGCETDDVLSALDFLRGVKNADKSGSLVGKDFGVYGVELGAYAGLVAASKEENIKALVIDSVPLSSDGLLSTGIEKRYPFASSITSKIAGVGTRLYYFNGCYNHESLCNIAKSMANRKILLLAGADAPDYQDSTRQFENCLPAAAAGGVESKLDLVSSGHGINNASLEQAELYDQRVIEFFRRSFGVEEIKAEESDKPTVENVQ